MIHKKPQNRRVLESYSSRPKVVRSGRLPNWEYSEGCQGRQLKPQASELWWLQLIKYHQVNLYSSCDQLIGMLAGSSERLELWKLDNYKGVLHTALKTPEAYKVLISHGILPQNSNATHAIMRTLRMVS